MHYSRECLQRMAMVVASFMLIAAFSAQAQLSGSKSVGSGGDYATIAIAIDSLNAQGVAAPGVTFNVAGDHTETSSNLIISVGTTAASPVVFQKSGAGANPLITAAPGTSASTDGIIKLSGTDYITFDRIDLLDPATNTGDQMMEWGYAVLRASSTNGSRFVTIKNCTITLQKINTLSNGIYHANRDVNGVTTNWTDSLGQNSNNRYFGNTISNVYHGIQVLSSSTARDENNEVGVFGEAPNTITNWGGSTVTTNGIRAEGQVNVKISNNVINGGGGTSGSAAVYGIIATLFGTSALAPNYEISHNTVTVSTTPTSQGTWGIRALATGDTVRLHNNIVENSSAAQNTSSFNALTYEPTGTSQAAYIHDNIIRDNTHGGTGTSNLLMASGTISRLVIHSNEIHGNQKTGASGSMYGIVTGDAAILCYSNAIYDNSIPNSSGTSAASVYGYRNSGSSTIAETLYNNTIYNLSVGGTSSSTANVVYGIYTTSGTSGNSAIRQIRNNLIHSLSSTVGTVGGIFQQYGSTVHISKNNIYNLSTSSSDTARFAAGIIFTGSLSGPNAIVSNNFISDIRAPNSNNRNGVMGINSTLSASNSSIAAYYNTIYLNATSAGATFGSSGISAAGNATSTTANLDLRNNIIVNLSDPKGAGVTTVLRRSNANFTNYSLSSNNNLLYAGTPTGSRLIYFDTTNAQQTLAGYQALVPPADAASFTTMPPFVNTSTTPYDLHMQTAVATQIESGGTAVSGITTDFDEDLRFGAIGYAGSGSAPDVGADEFEGTPLPVMTYVSSTSTQNTLAVFANSTSNHIIGIEIVTAGFSSPLTATNFLLNTNGTTNAAGDITMARVFYTGSSNGFGTSVEVGSFASPPAAPDTFSITGSQPLVNGSNYFWLTYDIPSTATGGNVVDAEVLSITLNATPQTPTITAPVGSRTIISALSGTYDVAPTEPYPFNSFNNVASVLGSAGVTGPVIFNVLPGSGPYNEQVEFTPIPGVSPTNTVTINGNGEMLTYSPTASDRFLIRLNGAQRMTINDLVIVGTDTTYGWGIHLTNAADNNAITNCTIDLSAGKNTSATHNLVGIVASGSNTSVSTAGNNANNCVFSGNTIQGSASGGPQGGIRLNGNSGGLNAVGNQILNNTIRDFYEDGIRLANNDGTLVSGNDINRANRATVTIFRGLTLTAGCRNVRIEKNRIHTTNAVGANPSATAYGIHFDLVDAPMGSENVAVNNMIYKFTSVTGIVWAIYNNGSDGAHCYFNSISIDHPDATGGSSTRGFYQTTTATNVVFRNNIISMTRAGTSPKHCLYFGAGASSITSDNNVLYVNAPAGTNSVGFLGLSYGTLAEWWATGHDSNSVDGNPAFTSSDDLHIDIGSSPPSSASNAGVPIAGVTDDFDGDLRDAVKPDIGADEFASPVATSVTAGWNLVSNPVSTANDSVRQLFPTSTFEYAFGFAQDIGYVQAYRMLNGSGYWTKFPGPTSVVFGGTQITDDSIEVVAGWNLIGSISAPVDTADITFDPPGIELNKLFYSYPYGTGDPVLLPGKGFWLKTAGAGNVILTGGSVPARRTIPGGQSVLSTMNTLTIRDAAGMEQTLYFGADEAGVFDPAKYEMPPLPPLDAFDIRFESPEGGRLLQTHASKVDQPVEISVLIQTAAYPITVSWDVHNGEYTLADGGGTPHRMEPGGSWVIHNSTVTRVVLRGTGQNSIPVDFALHQNYPNPFNPSTTIRFALPVEGRVRMEIINILGQSVRTLVNEELAAGYHAIAWDGTGSTEQQLGSGVYFVRMNATGVDGSSFTEMKKMMFLK